MTFFFFFYDGKFCQISIHSYIYTEKYKNRHSYKALTFSETIVRIQFGVIVSIYSFSIYFTIIANEEDTAPESILPSQFITITIGNVQYGEK